MSSRFTQFWLCTSILLSKPTFIYNLNQVYWERKQFFFFTLFAYLDLDLIKTLAIEKS